MDKNTIIGFVLIIAVVVGFTYLSKPSDEEIARMEFVNDSTRQAQEKVQQAEQNLKSTVPASSQPIESDADVNSFFQASNAVASNDTVSNLDSLVVSEIAKTLKDDIVSLENDLFELNFSTKGAQIVSARLKNYSTYNGDSLYLFNNDAELSLELENKSSVKLHTKDAVFTTIESADKSTLIFRLNYTDTQYIDFVYSLLPESYMVKFDINAVGMDDILSRDSKEKFILTLRQPLSRKEKSLENEQRYSRIYYKNTGLDVEELSDSKNDRKEVSNPVKWVAFKDQFFASTIIADNSFDISVLNSKKLDSQDYLKEYSAALYISPSVTDKSTLHTGFRFFLGPLQYSMLKSYDDGVKESTQELDLDKLIPLGWSLFRWINQYFIIPLFNLLNKTELAMGLIIFLLTLIVKVIISPLTYKSFMSSAKMRVLRPQVEAIGEKYPKQEQAMEKQRATMDLYRQAGASPMSGCVPMLLQMPILIALFSFFPSAIELRHQSFLWATDLSTYDAILEWKGEIPIISSILGNHLSLFCLLMTATNIVYTKFNMDATNTGQQQMPGMKWMMYLMPLIFLFVLNNYPSGLTYYYFISTLITILLTLSFRFLVDEKALLAKLEANKKKPKKKSGFMARIEEAQKLQQQQAREKAKSNAKKRK